MRIFVILSAAMLIIILVFSGCMSIQNTSSLKSNTQPPASPSTSENTMTSNEKSSTVATPNAPTSTTSKPSSVPPSSNTTQTSSDLWSVTSTVSTTKAKDMSKAEIVAYVEALINDKLPKSIIFTGGQITFNFEQKYRGDVYGQAVSLDLVGEFSADEAENFINGYKFGKPNENGIIANKKLRELWQTKEDVICFEKFKSLSNSYGFTIATVCLYTFIYPTENNKYAIHIDMDFFNKDRLVGTVEIQSDGSGKLVE